MGAIQSDAVIAEPRRAEAPVACATIKLLLAGLLLPNIFSLATMLSLIDLGLPPRTGAIILYGVVALCARRLPFALTCILFLAVLGFDLAWTISLMFGLAPGELLAALDHVRRIHLMASPLYVGLIIGVGFTAAASLALLARRDPRHTGNAYVLCAAVLLVASIDAVSNASAHFQFNSLFGRDRPLVSAAQASGFNAVAGRNGRNVVVVVVESLGYLQDREARERIAAPLRDRRIAANYVVTSGSAGYFGSTTAGEMRELCDTRRPYMQVAGDDATECLPEKLRDLGYATLSFHGFPREMFARDDWYPQIGFAHSYFAEDLAPRTRRLCGDAFRGVCDADLPPLIARQAAYANGPRFIYWLTLNTHIPVPPGDALTDFDCAADPHGFGTGRVCRMAELWHDLFAAVVRLATDPAIAPAEILVVGDHAPPLWSRRGRGQFAPGQVAWYRLTPR